MPKLTDILERSGFEGSERQRKKNASVRKLKEIMESYENSASLTKPDDSKSRKGFFSSIKSFFARKHFPKKSFPYFIDGKKQTIVFEFNSSSLNLPYVYYSSHSILEEYISRAVNFSPHRERLMPLVDAIRKKTTRREKQAKIAVSLVQNIPYKKKFVNARPRFPFEVIKENRGICGEKSALLAFLLKELGFGTAVFRYDKKDFYSKNFHEKYIYPLLNRDDFLHANVGVKCRKEYQYEGSGYAVIETTCPSIITDYSMNIKNVKPWAKRFPKKFKLIPVSEGLELDVSEEYYDAQEWIRLMTIADSGLKLSEKDFKEYLRLGDKYCFWS